MDCYSANKIYQQRNDTNIVLIWVVLVLGLNPDWAASSPGFL